MGVHVLPFLAYQSSLTRFKLASPFPSLASVSNILSKNSRLETLDMNIETVDLENPGERLDPTALDSLCVSLPQIRELSFKIGHHQICGLQLLKIIDAPNVEDSELQYTIGKGDDMYLRDDSDQTWGIPNYLAKGRVHGYFQSLALPAEGLGCGPIFPWVRKLNVGGTSSYDVLSQPETFAELLSTFIDITHLVAVGQCTDTMSEDPNTHIDLRHITFPTHTVRL